MTKNLRLTSPSGIAVFPRLNTPDTKFSELGMYKVDLKLTPDAAKPFIQKVVALQKEAAGKAKVDSSWWHKEVDDQGNETGNIVVRFKAKNVQLKDGSVWDRKPTLFNVYGERITDTVGGGSKIKVACELYFAHVNGKVFCSLQPIAVQVEDLVEYSGGNNAEDFGFEVSKDDKVEAFSEGEDESLF